MVARVLRVSIVGLLPGGEEWSVNPTYAIGGDFGVDVTPQQAQTIATAISAITIPTGLAQQWASGVSWTGCRVEARELTGGLVTQAEAPKAVPTAGTSAQVHPFQTAWVSSMRTAHPGARGRGRLYWPAHGVTLTAGTFRPGTSQTSTFISAVKTFLSSINTAIDVTLDGVSLAVWSRVNADIYPVTQIQVGDVLDVQRRRRDTLVEAITSTTFP